MGRIATRGRRAFTLAELLIVIGIIGLLLGIMLPVFFSIRSDARRVRCASNLRQVAQVILLYASDNRQQLPPNDTSFSPGEFWYDAERCGQYMRSAGAVYNGSIRGPSVTCPEDEDGLRSYAMNFFASSAVDQATLKMVVGRPWKPGARESSRLILATEQWSTGGSPKLGFVAQGYIGNRGTSPGRRFGGGGGLSPLWSTRLGALNCELPYMRHRTRGQTGNINAAIGRVNIAFLDGRVETMSNTALVEPSGRSTFEAMWTPADRELETPPAAASTPAPGTAASVK